MGIRYPPRPAARDYLRLTTAAAEIRFARLLVARSEARRRPPSRDDETTRTPAPACDLPG
jgi:hypothetical protein